MIDRTLSDRPDAVSSVEAKVAELLADGKWGILAELLSFDTAHRTQLPASALSAWGLDGDAAGLFDRLEALAAGPGYRLLLAESSADYREIRAAILDAGRLNAEESIIWWWVHGKGARKEQATVAIADERADGRWFVRRMDLNRQAPDAVGLRQWAGLDIADIAGSDMADPARALRRHVGEVLSQEGLTREFFSGFTEALDLLCGSIKRGPDADRDRHDVALTTLLRLVFLYFLQLRGSLDGDRRFVVRHFRQCRAAGDNFYGAVLKPLFFGALNCRSDRRDPAIAALGELPFLNGGLFEPLPIERAHPQIGWPDEVFEEVIEGLLERYHFTAREIDGVDEQRAVNPEMLGRVFEGLMYGQSRKQSGSFYTPRDVVRRLVDEALKGYLADAADLPKADIEHVVSGQPVALSHSQRRHLDGVLQSIKILDPAVGTGAFLVEALQGLQRCRRAISAAGKDSPAGSSVAAYRRVRKVIHDNLFGVDVQHTAVRLCELRLWLTLLATLPEMPISEVPPLPNLSHKICVGNSLLSPTDLVSVRSGPAQMGSWVDTVDEPVRELLDSLAHARRTFLTSHGDQKSAMHEQINHIEHQLQAAMLEARNDKLQLKIDALDAVGTSRDLFGNEVEFSDEQRREYDAIIDEMDALDEVLDGLAADRETRLAFSYATRFAQMAPAGGFDIVITNPPWVRAHRIDPSQRGLLRSRYRCHRRELWPGAAAAGIRVPFGPQIDLSALFVERSLELLCDGGRLCGLVPAKLFRSLYGTALREHLVGHDLVAIEDYSDASRRMFDATVYPAMVHVKKVAASRRHRAGRRPRQSRPVRVSVWKGNRRAAWKAPAKSLYAGGGQPGAPWVLVEPNVSATLHKMRRGTVPLGEVERLQPVRGMFTGCNDVFVHSDSEVRRMLGDDLAEFSRPVLSGRDVRPWSIDTDRRILWPYDSSLALQRQLPDSLHSHFDEHARRLEARSDYNARRPRWQMFRINDALTMPKVVWRDLSPKLEAARAPADVVPLNTVYFVALADDVQARLLAALFNGPAMRAAAYAIAERARGGWRRHFAWVMRLLPVPRRFVRFLEADPEECGECFGDLLDLDRAVSAEQEGAVGRLSANLFGLELDECASLGAWQTGGPADDQEVA